LGKSNTAFAVYRKSCFLLKLRKNIENKED
jgi:hypothetical protein